jgi:ABC-type Zn uptake system ZnuABC Zn-binding protein ZnuA
MKTLKESILSSTKTGKHFIDPKDIKTYDAALKYAKFLYGDKVREDKTGVSGEPGSQFIITFNKKLSMNVDCYRTTHFFYHFFDEKNDMLWQSEHLETNEVDWEILLNPVKWCKYKIEYYTKIVKKYEKQAAKYYSNRTKYYAADEKATRFKRKLATIEDIEKRI